MGEVQSEESKGGEMQSIRRTKKGGEVQSIRRTKRGEVQSIRRIKKGGEVQYNQWEESIGGEV